MDSIPAIVYEALQDMKTDFREAHGRIRADLSQATNATAAAHAKLSEQMTQLLLTVNTIQTERAMEKAEVMKRSAIVSLLAGAGITGVFKFLERWWH